MSKNDPPFEDDFLGDLPPLDDAERGWLDELGRADSDAQGDEDFVRTVVKRHEAATTPPAIVGRIGAMRPLHYLLAASLLIVMGVIWSQLASNAIAPNAPEQVAQPEDPQPQPEAPSEVVPTERPELRLGELIGQAHAGVTTPTTSLTAGIRDTPETFKLENLMQMIEQQNTEPSQETEDDNDTQSRA